MIWLAVGACGLIVAGAWWLIRGARKQREESAYHALKQITSSPVITPEAHRWSAQQGSESRVRPFSQPAAKGFRK